MEDRDRSCNPHESRDSRGDTCRGGRRRSRHRGGRKARILHTRISEPLAEDIRRLAEDLRVPVSNLVRNVLEEAFTVVETVTDNVGDLIEDAVEEADRARATYRHGRGRHRRRARRTRRGDEDPAEPAAPIERAKFPDVLGWQPLILNRPQKCADCEEALTSGDRAFVGMTPQGLASTYLCGDCMGARR